MRALENGSATRDGSWSEAIRAAAGSLLTTSEASLRFSLSFIQQGEGSRCAEKRSRDRASRLCFGGFPG
jgi:hypothetical protein